MGFGNNDKLVHCLTISFGKMRDYIMKSDHTSIYVLLSFICKVIILYNCWFSVTIIEYFMFVLLLLLCNRAWNDRRHKLDQCLELQVSLNSINIKPVVSRLLWKPFNRLQRELARSNAKWQRTCSWESDEYHNEFWDIYVYFTSGSILMVRKSEEL